MKKAKELRKSYIDEMIKSIISSCNLNDIIYFINELRKLRKKIIDFENKIKKQK